MTKNAEKLTKWWMWEGGDYIIILTLGLWQVSNEDVVYMKDNF